MSIVRQYAKQIEAALWVLFAARTISQDATCATLFFASSIVLRLFWETLCLLHRAPLARCLVAIPTLCVAYLWLTFTPAQLLILTPMDIWSPYEPRPPFKNFEELYRPNVSASVDIIAIHGLGSNPENAWTCRNDTQKVSWLRDILPTQGFETARIMMVNHQTRWDSRAPDMELSDHAAHLLGHIEDLHTDPTRPIVFIAHSFGGILLKKSLLLALGQRSSHVAAATKAIIFLGVPHTGTSFTRVASMLACTATWRGSDVRLLTFMSENSKEIYELDKDFRRSYPPSHSTSIQDSVYMCNFAEMRPEERFGVVIGPTVKMHPGASGYPRNRWLDTDHRGMNKFCAVDDPNMQLILDELRIALTSLQRSIPVTHHFVGRDHVLKQVHDLLWTPTPSGSLVLVSIFAAGGMGKTQIAMAYSRTYEQHFNAIFEVDGTSLVTCCTSFSRIREFLGRDDFIIEQEYSDWRRAKEDATFGDEVESACEMNYRLVHDWLLRQKGRPWLLVFDNVDDLETFNVHQFLPYDTQGKVLVTSRRPESCEWSQRRCVKLLGLLREDSRLLFQKQLSLNIQPETSVAKLLNNLLDKLDNMPLAVAQASAYISRRLLIFRGTHYKILQKLEEELRAYEIAFLEQLRKQSSIALRGYRNDSILTTWEISFQAIESQNQAAAELLQLMGFLNQRDLDPKLLRYAVLPSHHTTSFFPFFRHHQGLENSPTGQLSDAQLDLCFDLYSSYSLLEYREEWDTFSMHPLIHSWIRMRNPRPMRTYYATQAMRLVEAGWLHHLDTRLHTEDIFESVQEYFSTASIKENAFHLDPNALSAEQWPGWLETVIQKAMLLKDYIDEAVLNLMEILMPSYSRLVAAQWRYAYTLGDRVGHIGLVRWSYQETCSRLSYRHPFSLHIAGSYAKLLMQQRDFEKAWHWYQWLTKIRARTYGRDHLSTREALRGAADVLFHTRQWNYAEAFLSNVFKINPRSLEFGDRLTQEAFKLKVLVLMAWANRTAALDFVKELYESDHLHHILDDMTLSKVLGVVLYQAFGFNSSVFRLYEENPENRTVLAPLLTGSQWGDLVPDTSVVACNISLPGWCDCLRVWYNLVGDDWTEGPTPCDLPGNEDMVWGPYGGCQGPKYRARDLSEKCDIWLRRYLESDGSIGAAHDLLTIVRGLATNSFQLAPRTHDSKFYKWNWINRVGADKLIELLYGGHWNLSQALTMALYELTTPRDAFWAFLYAQSHVHEGSLEETCSWYREAEVASENAQSTCDRSSTESIATGCWTSVIHWAVAICYWFNGNFTLGQQHIWRALEAGELLNHEIALLLYDLGQAREHFGIKDNEIHVMTFKLALKSQSHLTFYHTGELEHGNWTNTTIHGDLFNRYGSDVASNWTDCVNNGFVPSHCEQFEMIRTYDTSDVSPGRFRETFANIPRDRWLGHTHEARVPHLYRSFTPGSIYSRVVPRGMPVYERPSTSSSGGYSAGMLDATFDRTQD